MVYSIGAVCFTAPERSLFMKKLLSLMLVLCMLLSVLPGFASDVAPLTVDEVAA